MKTNSEYKKKVLFVNHKGSQCGVYEFGKNVFSAIQKSEKYIYKYGEVGSYVELKEMIRKIKPSAIIYNYMLTTMPWSAESDWITRGIGLFKKNVSHNNLWRIMLPQIGIIHSIEQRVADEAKTRSIVYNGDPSNKIFDYYIAPDPTLVLNNSRVFKSGRPLRDVDIKPYEDKIVPRFGTVYLATEGKSFTKLIDKIQNEYDEAEIWVHIPQATFGGEGQVERCKKEIYALNLKAGISIKISDDFMPTEELIQFLSQNTANFYLREDTYDGTNAPHGIASSPDHALSAKRPIVLSESSMHRHVLDEVPEASIDVGTIKKIVECGFDPFQKIYEEWQPECICWEYDRIIDRVLCDWSKKEVMNAFLRLLRGANGEEKAFDVVKWTGEKNLENDEIRIVEEEYVPVIYDNCKYNTVLDDNKRKVFEKTIEWLYTVVPNAMKGKIKEANVQQAFCLDMVVRFANMLNRGKKDINIMCVGAYTSTDYLALKKMGYKIYANDPVLNYDLHTYIQRPDVRNKKMDIIFSTSVIEHVKDDEQFVSDIAKMLNVGGICIITCDYRNGYMPGDIKPGCDERLYTKSDFDRLLKAMPDCKLYGTSDWEKYEPDFGFQYGKEYNFATLVIKKGK